VVQQSVGKLSALRRDLQAAIGPASVVSRQFANPAARTDDAAAVRGAVRHVLQDLLAAVDRAKPAVQGSGGSEPVRMADSRMVSAEWVTADVTLR